MDHQQVQSISFKDFPDICRICLSKEDTLKPFVHLHIFNTFINITNIEIEPEDSLPKNVCTICLNNLEEISSFIQLSKNSDENLKKIHKEFHISLPIKDISSESESDSTEICDKPEDENVNVKEDAIKLKNPGIPVVIDIKNHEEKKTTIRHSTKRQPANCDVCGEHFSSKGRLIEHQKKSVTCKSKPYKCTNCEKAFFAKFKLKMHMRSHTKETPFECKICSKRFRFSANLKRHDDVVHKGLKPFKCDVCDKEFARLERKIQHMNIHTGNCPHVCGYCGRTFRYELTFKNHVTQHRIKNGEMQDLSKNKCQICKKIFFSKYTLQSHIETHVGETKFLCSICGKGFLKKNYLDVHFRMHTGEKPFECKHCDKKFKYASGYKTHILFHTGERSYKCNICSKTFKQSSHLQSHKKVHTGEKPFKCTFCEKTFAVKSNLTAHMRIHTGETPYHCTICEKGFYDSSNMKKHEKGHSY